MKKELFKKYERIYAFPFGYLNFEIVTLKKEIKVIIRNVLEPLTKTNKGCYT